MTLKLKHDNPLKTGCRCVRDLVERYHGYFRLKITLSSFVFASMATDFTAGSSSKTPSICNGSTAVTRISSPASCTETLQSRSKPTSELAERARGASVGVNAPR